MAKITFKYSHLFRNSVRFPRGVFLNMIVFLCFIYMTCSILNKLRVLLGKNDLLKTIRIYDEAYLTLCDRNHESLMEVLVESLHYHSTRPIIVYGIDYDIKISKSKFPRVEIRRLDSSECGDLSLYSCKVAVIYKSEIRHGIYLDADSVANFEIDTLFDVIKAWDGSHVLSPVHWFDPNNTEAYWGLTNVTEKTMHYVHADSILWNHRHKDFIKRWWEITMKINGANYDETALNLLLWQMKAHHSTCIFDSPHNSFPGYLLTNFVEKQLYLTFHGEKDPKFAYDIHKYSKGLENSKLHNFDYLLKNCCQKGGKESRYHPYICEFGLITKK